jgi:hypothetical protein
MIIQMYNFYVDFQSTGKAVISEEFAENNTKIELIAVSLVEEMAIKCLETHNEYSM